jgi:hypothetical protein
MKFTNPFRTKDPKRLFPEQKHVIEHAFSVGGVDYYQFNDVFSLPYERGLMAITFYEELRMKCTYDNLKLHVEAIRTLLNEPKIDIYKVNALNEMLGERLGMVTDVNLLYKLVSVVFFDKNENPCLYEIDYNLKKIEQWKKHKGVNDFFLQKPLQELIPFLNTVDLDLSMYSPVVEAIKEHHLQVLSSISKRH